MYIFTKTFWSYAGERAIKTVAQTLVASVSVAGITGVLDVMWVAVLSTAGLAGLVSLLTSLGSYDSAKNLSVTNEAQASIGTVSKPVVVEADPETLRDTPLY